MKQIINGIEVTLTQEEILLKQQQDAEFNAGAFDRAIKEFRNIRNDMLAKTDWYITKAKENNEEVPVNIKQYRQALRDITNNLTTIEEINAVVFPTIPKE